MCGRPSRLTAARRSSVLTTALPFASCPVTIRLTSRAMAFLPFVTLKDTASVRLGLVFLRAPRDPSRQQDRRLCGGCGERYIPDAVQGGWNSADPSGRRAESDGARDVRRGFRHGGHALRQGPALAARPCPHPVDRCLEGGGLARCQGDRDRRGFPRS